MAIEVIFGTKKVTLPGAYSQIKSKVSNAPLALDYGIVLIIDTGNDMAGVVGGAGINGEFVSGLDSLVTFQTIDEMRSVIRGGLWWLLAKPLFQPSKNLNVAGVSQIIFARACTTVAPRITIPLTGGGPNGGTTIIATKEEGVGSNGVEDVTDLLTRGYGATMEADPTDATKFIFKFWRGTFTGNDGDGDPWSALAAADTIPELLAVSPSVDNVADLHTWMKEDPEFNTYFRPVTTTAAGTGAIDTADLANNSGNILAAGGTETYGASDLTDVFETVKNELYTFVLADQYEGDGDGTENTAILAHITQDARFHKYMVVAGYDSGLSSSQAIAAYYNSNRVIVVHGAPKKTYPLGDGFKNRSVLYKAANFVGRMCGVAPQIPLTFKDLEHDGEVEPLNDREAVEAINSGLIVTRFDPELAIPSFAVVQAVNSLQGRRNKYLVNTDGTSFEISLERIASQINNTLVLNAKAELLSDPSGVNRNTLNDQDLIEWTKGQLNALTVNDSQDNLIITYQNVQVETRGDAKYVSYEFEPNGPINKLFFTGFIINL